MVFDTCSLKLFLIFNYYVVEYFKLKHTNKKKLKHNHKEKEHSKLELVVKALNVISNVFCNRLTEKLIDAVSLLLQPFY
jgi:dipeptide/tripeptide permease